MAENAIVAPLALAIDSSPMLDGAAALDRLADSATRGEGRINRIAAASDALIAALDRNTRATSALTSRMEEADRAGSRVSTSLRGVSGAAEAANSNVVRLGRSVDGAASGLTASAAAADKTAAAWRNLGAAGEAVSRSLTPVGRLSSLSSDGSVPTRLGTPGTTSAAAQNGRLSSFQAQNLAYQASDVIASAASGMSPLTIALQQGGQIAPTFMGPGSASVGGALKQAGEAATGFLGRIGLVGVGLGVVTGAAATGITAMLSFQSSMRETERAVSGVGRASGVSADQIGAYARAASDASGIGTRAAREAGGDLASTGRIGGEMIGRLLGSLKDFAATTAQEMPEASQDLARAFADPANGADLLNARLGFLDDRTAQTIRTLQEQGDRLGAQRALFDAYAGSLTKAADLTTAWGRATETAFGPIKSLWDFIGQQADKAFNGGTLEERLENAQVRLRNIRDRQAGPGGSFVSRPLATSTQKEVDDLTRQLEERTRRSTMAAAAQNSREIGDLTRTLDPAGAALDQMQARVEKLRKAIADPVRFGLDPILLAQAQTAFERLSVLARNLREDTERYGDAGLATAVRQAELQNRLATERANPVDRQISERRFQYEEKLRERGLDPKATADQVNADYNAKSENADARDLNSLAQARTAALRLITERDALTRVLTLDVDTTKKETETRASRSQNVESYMSRAVGVESGGDPNARNTRSTATGLGQFLEGTWLPLFRERFPERAAGMSRDEILSRRTDRGDSIEILRLFTEQNARSLEKAGLATTDRNLYLSHFAGQQGAVDLLRADRGASAASILGSDAARANPTIIGGGRTVGNVIDYADRVINRAAPAVRASNREVAVLRTQTTLTDQTTEAETRRQRIQELLNAEIERGTALGRSFTTAQDLLKASASQLTPEMETQRKVILETAGAYGKAQAALENSRIGRDILFDRAQIDRSQQDQGVASRLRGTGLGMDSAEADALRLNDNLRQTRDLANGVFSGMLGDLRQGVSAATLLGNITNRLADKLLSTASDRVISGLFSGGGKDGGGFLSGIASLFGSATLPKFADGGISRGPSIFGEAGPEAAVPLPDGRRIPVQLMGPANSNGGGSLTQNFITQGNVEMRPGPVVTDGQGNRKQDVIAAEIFTAGANTPRGQAALSRNRLVST